MAEIIFPNLIKKEFPKLPYEVKEAIIYLVELYNFSGFEELNKEIWHIHQLQKQWQGYWSVAPLGKENGWRILGRLLKNGNFKVIKITFHDYTLNKR